MPKGVVPTVHYNSGKDDLVMNQPPLMDMISNAGSKYLLVVLAAKRARQITEAGTSLVVDKSTKPVTISLYETAEGKLKFLA